MSALYTQAAAIICLKYHQPHVDTRHKNKIYIKAKNACHRTRTFFKKYTVCSLLLVTTSTLFHELTNPWAWNSQLDVKCITELSSYHLCPSVLWRCWLGGRKGIRPVKNWVVGCWRGYLGWDADLHIAQQMPLPVCHSPSLAPVNPGFYLSGTCSSGWSRTNSRRAVKRLYVCIQLPFQSLYHSPCSAICNPTCGSVGQMQ